MYEIIQPLHSYLAYITFALLLFSTGNAFSGKINNRPLDKASLKWSLFAFIATHTQLLLGLILYVVSPYGLDNLSGDSMKDAFKRLLAVEHPFTNILGVVLITVGYLRAKKTLGTDKAASQILYFYLAGIFLFLSRIPWANWLG
jgi:hypothetical protein